jgi:hypothetical protein
MAGSQELTVCAAGPTQTFIKKGIDMNRIINNPIRYVQSILESWLELHDGTWLTQEEAIDLVHTYFAELDSAELDRIIASDAIIEGSTLKRHNMDGSLKFGLNPKIERNYE